MDFRHSPRCQDYVNRVRAFVTNVVRPVELEHFAQMMGRANGGDWTKWKVSPAIEALKERARSEGLWNLFMPDPKHGAGLSTVEYAPLAEEMGRSFIASEAFNCSAPDTGNMEVLHAFGTPEQKERYLEPLLANDVFSCFAMTEPQGGSDPTNLHCRAIRDGDDWIISGEKFFASNANHAAFMIVMCATDPDAPVYSRATMFIVPTDAPGFQIVRNIGLWTDGPGSGGHPWLRFNDVRVPDSARLGPVGEGFKVAQSRLGGGRLHHAQRTIGVVKQMIDMMAERALSRSSYGQLLSEKQAVQEAISRSYIEYMQFRLLVLYTAWMFDQHLEHGREGRKMIAAVKAAMAKLAQDVTIRTVHLHGAIGLSNVMRFGQRMATALHEGVADGVTELHHATVSKQLLREYAPAPGHFPTEVVWERKVWAQDKLAPLLEELGVTFEESRANLELDPPVQKY